MEPLTYVLIIAACLLASAFFSSSETALLRMRPHDVESEIEDAKGPAPFAVRALLGSTSWLLVTILLGNNVVNILGSAVASALAVSYLGAGTGIVVTTVVMTVLVLIFAEILPKAIAARSPRGVSAIVGLPLYLLHQMLRPVHMLFDRAVEPLVNRIAGGLKGEGAHSSEELLRLARMARVEQPDGTPLSIIGATAGAADMTVSEILIPRTEIVAFPVDAAPAKLLEEVLQEQYTRVPIFEGTIDKILGVVHLKDLVKLVNSDGGGLHGIIKPVLRVPGRKPILRLLGDMQRAFVHVAIVKDEFGVTLGMATQEDILEEIVGEIRDEFDRDELHLIRALPDGDYQALGRIKVLDFNRETGWNVPARRGDTLSGLVFNVLGRAPRRGDVAEVEGYELSVADLSGTRITQVRLRKLEETDEDD